MLNRYNDLRKKLLGIKNPARKEAVAIMNALVDDIEFSDIDEHDGFENINAILSDNAESLDIRLNNIINDNSSDFSSVEEIITTTRRIIKDRNLKIKFN